MSRAEVRILLFACIVGSIGCRTPLTGSPPADADVDGVPAFDADVDGTLVVDASEDRVNVIDATLDGSQASDAAEVVDATIDEAQPVCGDGIVDPGEQCDDGNLVNGDGCERECTVSMYVYVKASNTQLNAQLGWNVALSADGSTLAVGAVGEGSVATGINGNQTDNSAVGAGAVYVFMRSGTTWVQQAYIKASNTDGSDQFGTCVALSADGSTLAVGAFDEDSAATGVAGNQADNSAPAAGAVYLFTRSGTTWSQQAYVKASNTDSHDRFGSSVALSADGFTLAVGAWSEASAATGVDGNQADNSVPAAGAVYLYTRNGTSWNQQAYVKASNAGQGDSFGTSVALSADGSTLAVGASTEDSAATGIDGDQADNSAIAAGAVYVFTHDQAPWKQQAYVKASDSSSVDNFGTSVALSADGSTLAVGALRPNRFDTGGAAYVFTRGGNTWSQQGLVHASNPNFSDEFGWSLALSADGFTLAVGAPFEDSAATGINGDLSDNSSILSGAVYRFTRSGTAWGPQVYLKASNTDVGDSFGWSVAISADGTLAVGAPFEESAATGIGGNQSDNSVPSSGSVYVIR